MTVIAGLLVLPAGLVRGWLRVSGGLIAEVGHGDPPRQPEVAAAGYVLPGLVDIHCHGGNGGSFDLSADPAAFHLRHGTTAVMASLGTTTRDALLHQVRALSPAVADGTVIGVHLEGPYLSHARCGAHPPHLLREPDWAELAEVLAAGGVRMVTLAPELPRALAMIERLARQGITVAIGHTDASHAQTQAGIDAGATIATHLFNGMRPIHHRDGGPVPALLSDQRVWCELICDGHHLSPEICRFAFHHAGPERTILITDACTAAGMPDGSYLLGGEPITLTDGAVRTADGRSLAGSALTLIAAVRFAVSCGIPLPDAVRAATANPAAAIGLTDRGSLATGLRADIIITDKNLHLTQVMRSGTWH